MNKKAGDILILMVGAVLLVYTAYRSLHVVQSTLPPDAQVIGFAALFGLDFALLAWTVFKAKSARGDVQNAIAMFMIILQWVGVTALTLGDTLLTADPGNAPGYIRAVALWAAPIVISINVGAAIAVHLADPTREIEAARRSVQDEIQKQVAEQLRQNAAQIASMVTPVAADHNAKELLAEFMSGPSGNGQKPAGMVFTSEGAEVGQNPKATKRKR
jgi:hypothetical protein